MRYINWWLTLTLTSCLHHQVSDTCMRYISLLDLMVQWCWHLWVIILWTKVNDINLISRLIYFINLISQTHLLHQPHLPDSFTSSTSSLISQTHLLHQPHLPDSFTSSTSSPRLIYFINLISQTHLLHQPHLSDSFTSSCFYSGAKVDRFLQKLLDVTQILQINLLFCGY